MNRIGRYIMRHIWDYDEAAPEAPEALEVVTPQMLPRSHQEQPARTLPSCDTTAPSASVSTQRAGPVFKDQPVTIKTLLALKDRKGENLGLFERVACENSLGLHLLQDDNGTKPNSLIKIATEPVY